MGKLFGKICDLVDQYNEGMITKDEAIKRIIYDVTTHLWSTL